MPPVNVRAGVSHLIVLARVNAKAFDALAETEPRVGRHRAPTRAAANVAPDVAGHGGPLAIFVWYLAAAAGCRALVLQLLLLLLVLSAVLRLLLLVLLSLLPLLLLVAVLLDVLTLLVLLPLLLPMSLLLLLPLGLLLIRLSVITLLRLVAAAAAAAGRVGLFPGLLPLWIASCAICFMPLSGSGWRS